MQFKTREKNYNLRRKFRQFDVYTCDLDNDSLGDGMTKTRPCVIIQQPLDMAVSVMVAPIRTPHENVPITDENVKEYVDFIRTNKGSIYVPMKFYEDDEWRMIDLTKQCPVYMKNINYYQGTIEDPVLLNKLQNGLCLLYGINVKPLASKEKITREREAVNSINKFEPSGVNDNSTPCGSKQYFPEDFGIYYQKVYIDKIMRAKDAAAEIGVRPCTFSQYKKAYEDKNGLAHINLSVKTGKYSSRPASFPTGFTLYYMKYENGSSSKNDICEKLNISERDFNEYEKFLLSKRKKRIV